MNGDAGSIGFCGTVRNAEPGAKESTGLGDTESDEGGPAKGDTG